MINHCLQSAFTFTLQFMRFTSLQSNSWTLLNTVDNFFSIVPETCWESSNCSSSLCTRWRQSLNYSRTSRIDNSKFYYSLHLLLPDLPSWSLLLGLHRASKDFLLLQLSCSQNRTIPKVVLSRLKRTPMQNISNAINGLRKNVAFLTASQTTNYLLITSFCTQKQANFACQ